jgi:Mor family transcriptional regulator
MGDRYPEILTDLAEHAAELLHEECGIPQPDAERVARKLADRIGETWAGCQPYIGKGAVLDKRDLEIVSRFNGANHACLAREYELTERQIYNIIARVRSEEIRRRQVPLFPE